MTRVCTVCGEDEVYQYFDENGEYWICDNCGEEYYEKETQK